MVTALNILSLPVGLDGCSGYRIRKPLDGLRKYTQHDTVVLDIKSMDIANVLRFLPTIDVIMMRPGSEQGAMKMREIKEVPIKAKWVLDIDDNTDLISPYSQFYKEYGLQEYQDDGKWIWKDGEKGFSIQNNIVRHSYHKWGLKNADMVIVTTQKLAEYARKFNKNVYVNDNTIDFNVWWRLNNKINKPLKVVWQGSPSHYQDWYVIKEPLNKLMREYGFTLYMAGSNYMGIFDEDVRKQVITLPWVSFDAHSYRMMALQPDIALVPLADMAFNHYKSAIKFYEMSAMGVPSVVSNVTPYKEEIQPGKTALAYTTPDEFYTSLKSLLTNKGLRANIGNAAYQYVFENKNLELESKKLAKALETLCQS
jgi:glycosyltransferase involved in cell wall biosynthesis